MHKPSLLGCEIPEVRIRKGTDSGPGSPAQSLCRLCSLGIGQGISFSFESSWSFQERNSNTPNLPSQYDDQLRCHISSHPEQFPPGIAVCVSREGVHHCHLYRYPGPYRTIVHSIGEESYLVLGKHFVEVGGGCVRP